MFEDATCHISMCEDDVVITHIITSPAASRESGSLTLIKQHFTNKDPWLSKIRKNYSTSTNNIYFSNTLNKAFKKEATVRDAAPPGDQVLTVTDVDASKTLLNHAEA